MQSLSVACTLSAVKPDQPRDAHGLVGTLRVKGGQLPLSAGNQFGVLIGGPGRSGLLILKHEPTSNARPTAKTNFFLCSAFQVSLAATRDLLLLDCTYRLRFTLAAAVDRTVGDCAKSPPGNVPASGQLEAKSQRR